MLGSRASRIGLLILKQLTGGGKSINRPTYASRSFSQFLQPRQYDQQSGTNLFRGAIFQKHHHFSTTTVSSSDQGTEQKETISVTFVDKDGDEIHIKVPIGMSMLEAAHQNDIDLEGACEGSLACSTCHVIVMDMEYYNKLEDPTDEENDMLDLAFGLTETSRLGCQVIASPELDGVRLAIPAATRNFAVDGYVPKPH
ncbi:2Fe-2S ferredoxin isoform X1 [Rosa chinensis]|uniref:2Fe-2S ferredoxin isoform X1 n=1 Tax=Rosa chinensis TaxID=74649 RepID=UPI001AD8BC62|nr:2Fe-2S ferredoxin isoform X1 [Rosa chinensis]XP_040365185.1 2Fe-2S ferredoxin isoform X1 [Rosa chinensis]XP_040365186.1 2Fe-2S ferredoxin isoform X1 [Rosa chinensis]XP_040365187.1 2Fe-2S ferredoxin isoform X1 [Rosa chinensis]